VARYVAVDRHQGFLLKISDSSSPNSGYLPMYFSNSPHYD
jgi:hypothetical protein